MKILSEEHKNKIRQAQLGRKHPHTEETKQKISKTLLGIKRPSWNLERRRKASEYFTGKIGYWAGKKRNKKIHEALRISNLGRIKEKSANWKGGITPINTQIRESLEYKLWRKSVFERDSYTCLVCGKVGGEINAHHIKSFSKYPKLIFEINNGATLCKGCHYLTFKECHTKKD